MSLVFKVLMTLRARALSRQAREIRRVVEALPREARLAAAEHATAEMDKAGRLQCPHLHGADGVPPLQPWSDVAEQAVARTQSGALQLKVKGVAQWIAVAYYETLNSPHPGLAGVHREVLGMLGDLKGSYAARAAREHEIEVATA
ncbi:hypothetical protein [Coralloluteibacterium stylophorae]|uniref:Uncharacterized protein n=1 Tax=Coralloluteibacterium stylophorae TaxID=1776034 RepID=A0A8J8AZT0_9GAMM|nr:hypothetical protein [Coralloluteibacterium stylophorae]MBS7456360.1 hypothetical protein [Coralloluteibacterium stylophorae]